MTACLLFIQALTATGLLFFFPDYIRVKLSLPPELVSVNWLPYTVCISHIISFSLSSLGIGCLGIVISLKNRGDGYADTRGYQVISFHENTHARLD